MSKLTFQRSAGIIILTSRKHEILGVWQAHNKVVSTDRDAKHHSQWPVGTWQYGYSLSHNEEQMYPAAYHSAYGGLGIHIFRGNGLQDGMGVHTGRTFGEPMRLGGRTYGCIRVTREAMEIINQTHQTDRLESITVEP